MGWTAWVRFPAVQDFSLFHSIQTCSAAHPASYRMGTGGVSHWGVKRQGREADHSPPSSTEVKNGGAIPLLPHVFMA
jgi:hypothetical protein